MDSDRPSSAGPQVSLPGRGSACPDLLLALLLLLAGFALYARTASFGFVFDDVGYVENNPLLEGGLTLANAGRAFTATHESNWHPLTWLSHQLDRELFGTSPAGPHLVNAALFGLDGALLFLALLALGLPRRAGLLVAALFLAHPLRVESVAWISERKDVLSGVFFALALWAHAAYARAPSAGRHARVLAAVALGLLAKPMLVTLPFVLLVLDVWPLGRLRAAGFGRLLLEKVPLLALSAGSVVVTLWAQRAARVTLEEAPLDLRALNAVAAHGVYLLKTVWPTGLACPIPLVALVGDEPRAELWPAALASGAVLLAITVAALLLRRRFPALLAGWLLFLGMLVPVAGWVQVGTAAWASRYAFLATLGLYLPLAVAWERLLDTPRWRVPALGAAAVALVALTFATVRQQEHWRDDEALFSYALAVTERNHVAHNNLGLVRLEQGRWEEARVHFEEALRVRPSMVQAHGNLARACQELGRLDEALAAVRRFQELEPGNVNAWLREGQIRLRGDDVEGALAAYRRGLDVLVEDADLFYNAGVLEARLGRAGRAAEAYARAAALRPDFAAAHAGLGLALADLGRRGESERALRRALDLDPEQPQALAGLEWLRSHPR